MNTTDLYAIVYPDGQIELRSIAATAEHARNKYLVECMGWRFDHPDRYSRADVWQRQTRGDHPVRLRKIRVEVLAEEIVVNPLDS